MNIPQLYYSIDDLALYLAELDPYEVGSVADAVIGNWVGAALADQWQVTIIQHIATKSLLLSDDYYVEHSRMVNPGDLDYEFPIIDDPDNDLSIGGAICSPYSVSVCTKLERFVENLYGRDTRMGERVIPIENIRKWADNLGIDLWFDSNSSDESTKTKNKVIEPETNKLERDYCSCPDWVKDVELLLDDSHEKTAPELAIALRAWLKAIQDPSINPKNVPDGIQKYFPTGLSGAATERLRTTTNWNKLGNAQKK